MNKFNTKSTFSVVLVVSLLLFFGTSIYKLSSLEFQPTNIGNFLFFNEFYSITKVLDPLVLAVVSLFIALFFFFKAERRAGLIMFIATISSVFIAYGLKDIFKLPRPNGLIDEVGWSFPSIHSTTGTSFFFALAYVLRDKIKDKFLYSFLLFVAIVAIFVLAASRVFLGVHHLEDVVAGIFLGLATASLSIMVLKKPYS